MTLRERWQSWLGRKPLPEHLRRGQLGERAARKHLRSLGLKFLAANYRSARGEIDLVFRERDCLVFVEVKTRSSEDWTRPAAAVDARKRRLLSQTALDYLRELGNPPVKIRFDIGRIQCGKKVAPTAQKSCQTRRNPQYAACPRQKSCQHWCEIR